MCSSPQNTHTRPDPWIHLDFPSVSGLRPNKGRRPTRFFMLRFDVEVPQGVGPGEELLVDAPNGDQMFVTIPKTASSGDLISIEHLPQHSPQQHSTLSPTAKSNHAREVEVVVPEGIHEGESFTVETHEGMCFDVICPDGCGAGCAIVVTLPHVDETPDFESAMVEAPQEAEERWWHRYRPGRRVKVLRSDGVSYSSAKVVLSYEGVFGALYHVRLDNGADKMAVPEDEIFDAEDADDPNFAAHLAAALEAAMEAEMLDAMCGSCGFYD